MPTPSLPTTVNPDSLYKSDPVDAVIGVYSGNVNCTYRYYYDSIGYVKYTYDSTKYGASFTITKLDSLTFSIKNVFKDTLKFGFSRDSVYVFQVADSDKNGYYRHFEPYGGNTSGGLYARFNNDSVYIKRFFSRSNNFNSAGQTWMAIFSGKR